MPAAPDQMAMTPNRASTLELDIDDIVLVEGAYSTKRAGADIAPQAAKGATTDPNHVNVKFWPSTGAWTLAPLQDRITNITELTDSYSLVIRASQMTLVETLSAGALVAILKEQPMWTKAVSLAGMTYGTNVATVGDYMLLKRIPADATWANALVGQGTAPGDITVNFPMDRVGVSNDSYPADQAYFLRFRVSGIQSAATEFLWGFLFGQYYIVFGGSGEARLYEYCQDAGHGDVVRLRDQWRYCDPRAVSQGYHTLGIWPHFGPSGERLLLFTNNALTASEQVSSAARSGSFSQTQNEQVYTPDDGRRGTDLDASPGHVTAAGTFKFDIRRDLKVDLQISKYGWAPSGTLIDQPCQLPDFIDPSIPVFADMSAVIPTATTLTPTLVNADTGSAYAAGNKNVAAHFAMTGDGHSTPILWSYWLRRAPVAANSSPGSVSQEPSNVDLVGPSGDPSQETGSVQVKDVTGDLYDRLSNRGEFAARFKTSFSPNTDGSGSVDVVLMRGYALRPTGTPRAVPGRKRGAFGTVAATFPSDNWRNYQIPLVGMWQRLQEMDYQGTGENIFRQFSDSHTSPYEYPTGAPSYSPGDTLVPWKVTDAVRDMLYQAGFPVGMVNIPDYPIRLWQGQSGKVQDQWVGPTQNLADTIVRWLRNYLGGYLMFDANAGDNGQWTIPFNPPITDGVYDAIWNFVTVVPSGIHGAPHMPYGYPSATAPILGKPSFSPVPPAFNVIRVVTGVGDPNASSFTAKFERFLFNFNSFPVPGSTVTLDPTHPDFLGRRRQATIIDPSLTGATDAATQAAVDWTARRIYDFTAHGQRIIHFTAPLCFYNDPVLGKYRPLRFLDPIAIDGDATWVLKCVRPRYRFDRFQYAEYEAIQPIAGHVQGGGIVGLEFLRRSYAKHSLKANGSATFSNLYGNLGVAPGAEERILALPTRGAARTAMQNADGTFHSIAGWNVLTGGSG